MIRLLLTAAILFIVALTNLCHAQWVQLPGKNNRWCITMHANDSHIFVGTQDSGLLRTSDLGQTWQHINTGLPDSIYPHVIYQDGARLFLGTHLGGFLSTDNDPYVLVEADGEARRVHVDEEALGNRNEFIVLF